MLYLHCKKHYSLSFLDNRSNYKDQTYKLGDDEKELKEKIMKFRDDELHHKDIAYDNGATKEGLFGVLDKIIKTSSKIAITISQKI